MSKVKAGEAFVEIGGDARKFFAAMSKVNAQIGKMGRAMSSAGTKMAAAGGAVVGPILASAQAFASVGSAIYDMSKRTGVAAESLSVLKYAAEQTGTDMAGVETAVKKMQKAIYGASNGSKEAADALAMVGLSAQDLAGLSADEQMGKIADGLMAIEDPGTRAAVAMQIFGKAGTSILPMLEGGSAGMAAFADEAKRLGLVMDAETAAKADALGDSIDALKSAMKMAFIQIGSAVAPILTEIASALATVAAGVGRFISENQQLAVSVLKWGAAFTAGGAGLVIAGRAISFVSGGLAGFMGVAGGTLKALQMISGGAISLAYSFVRAVAGVVAFSGASIASAVASGAAWAAANAPLLILLGILGGLGVMAVNAMGGLQGISDAVTGTLGGAVADATVVFGDLFKTATTTFGGIYDAIANGDLAGAMDILWAGLTAGWLRGVEAIMSYVDPWISTFQNTFTYLGTTIAQVWDATWTTVSNGFNTFGAYLQGAFDNIVNGVLATWDGMVAAVRKSWNYVQSFIRSGYDLEKENKKVDDEMSARARERAVNRPGIEGRTATAARGNAQATRDSEKRRAAMQADADATAQGRIEQNAANAARRTADRRAAESNVAGMSRDQSERRSFRAQADNAIERLGSASTMEAVQEIAQEFAALRETGRLTEEQIKKYGDAVDAASERIETARGEAAAAQSAVAVAVDPAAIRAAAVEAAASQAEVAGTFSSAAVGGMGYGASLQQKQLDKLTKIEENTRVGDEGKVAA